MFEEYLMPFLTVLSLVFSVGNTLYLWFWGSRVHLRVTVKVRDVYNAAGYKTEDRLLIWNISNASAFAVYLDELGFCDKDYLTLTPIPVEFIRKPKSSEPIEFPYKLESREGIRLQVSHSSQTEELRKHTRMYVKTCCGYRTSVKIPLSSLL